jgi:hypothetical protein
MGVSASWNLQGLSRPVMGLLYLCYKLRNIYLGNIQPLVTFGSIFLHLTWLFLMNTQGMIKRYTLSREYCTEQKHKHTCLRHCLHNLVSLPAPHHHPRLPHPRVSGYFSSQNFSLSQLQSYFIATRLWRWNRRNVPKRWYLNYRRRGKPQKKSYDVQNTAKVWNQ